MKYIKTFEKKDNFDLDVKQYVKFRSSSPFYEKAKDRIFKIDRKDNAFFFLKDIYGNYTDIIEISKPNVRPITTEEKEELDFLLSQQKYNI